MDILNGLVEQGVSVVCKLNRVYQTYVPYIYDDIRKGAPELLSGKLPSSYGVGNQGKQKIS